MDEIIALIREGVEEMRKTTELQRLMLEASNASSEASQATNKYLLEVAKREEEHREKVRAFELEIMERKRMASA